jgi:spermidine/putrescine transport system permease protein
MINEMADTYKGEVRFGEQLTRRGQILRSALTSGPAIAWTTVFLLAPLAVIGVISFMSRGTYGEIQLPFTFENFTRFMGFGYLGFDALYPVIILRSLLMALGTTLLCIVTALPLAFFIATRPERYKNLALTLVIIPFWTNLLIRTYAWQILLAPESWITQAAVALGLSAPGAPLYPGLFAVSLGMISAYLPFMVLPLYTAVEKIDWSIAEAAMDLGADARRVFQHALLPQLVPGLAAGIVLVFIPATGQFVVTDLLGGSKTILLGNAIQQQFGPSRDWPFGSAIAFLGMGVVMLGLWLHARMSGGKQGDLI